MGKYAYTRYAFYRQDFWWFHIRKTSGFCYYWNFVLFWNVAFGFAVSNSYQCNYRCDKCHSVFWSLHRSHSMYFAYFSSRSHKRSVFCNFYPASSAVWWKYPWSENSRRLYRTFQFYGYCCHHDRGRSLWGSGNDRRSSCICRTLCSDLETDQSFS